MTRPNRWNAARDKHDAAIRCPQRKRTIKPAPRYWAIPLIKIAATALFIAIIVDTLK